MRKEEKMRAKDPKGMNTQEMANHCKLYPNDIKKLAEVGLGRGDAQVYIKLWGSK